MRGLHSLRTEIFVGAVLLLATAVGGVAWTLIVRQQRALTEELQRTALLQARNVALSSERALLRDDPEFELCPLVRRLIDSTPLVRDVTIVDARNRIQGHVDLVRIGTPWNARLAGAEPVVLAELGPGERLYRTPDACIVVTPVRSAGRDVGRVALVYSTAHLREQIRQARDLTLSIAGGALGLALLLGGVLFRRIAHPLDAMMAGVRRLAAGELGTRIDVDTRNELGELAAAFNAMSRRLRSARDQLVAKERMDRELELAAEIQHSLLPRDVRPPDGFEIATAYHAATEVGGDYVDVIPRDDGRLVMVVADVAGKGVPGLVLMAMVKTAVQQLAATEASPEAMLRRLNATLHGTVRETLFVTMWLGVLDPGSGTVTCANAGHNPMVVYDAATGVPRAIRLDGVPLGPFGGKAFDATIRNVRLDLRPGDVLLQYTDGLNESRSPGGAQFGLERIVDHVARLGRHGPRAVLEGLERAERTFRGDAPRIDDITLLVVGMTAARARRHAEPVV